MKNNEIIDIPVRVEVYTLESLIGGIRDLAEGVRRTAFDLVDSHYNENTREGQDWFCTNYTMVSGAIRLIEAAASVVDNALVNSEIEIVCGPNSTDIEKEKCVRVG